MEAIDFIALFSGFFEESRATFCIEIDNELAVKSISKGYFKSIHDHHHEPVGMNIRDLVAGNPVSISAFADCIKEEPLAITMTLSPPFPAPRNVKGFALRVDDNAIVLILERDIGPIGRSEDAYQPKTTVQNVHRELLDAQAELSRVRKELEYARTAIGSLETRRSMLELFIPLLENVAESAKALASKAVIIATRLDSGSKTLKLVEEMENEGIELHAAANRILRGLK